MKKTCVLSICFIVLLFGNGMTRANDTIAMDDRYNISQTMKKFVEAVNDKDSKAIETLVLSADPGLVNKIQDRINSIIFYAFGPSAFERTPEGNVKVSGRYKEKGIGFKSKGFSTYFVLKKVDGNWIIIDTDFYKSFSYKSLLAFILCMMVGFVFWLWMLIDCARSNHQSRVKWILIIVLLNILGALLYFFFAWNKRRRAVR